MQVLWLACSLLLGLILEIALGCQGVMIPALCLVVFHFGVMRHYWRTLMLGCVMGVLLDLALGRSAPVHLLLVPLTVLLARLWRRYQVTYLLILQAIPGGVVGMSVAGIYALHQVSEMTDMGWLDYRMLTLKILTCGLLSGLAFPCLCRLLEWGSFRLDQPRYSRIGADYLEHSSEDDALEVVDVDD